MSWIESFWFGILQGITEFLPVSSSAHLKLFKIIMACESNEEQVFIDLIGHLGTLAAILVFFRKDILHLLKVDRQNLRFLLLATLPLVPCYLLLKPLREWASSPQHLGFCLMTTSAILFLGHRWRPPSPFSDSPRRLLKEALMIGTMQSAALIPGISRSASTISCARILGWQPRDAVRFSFLLSIPTVIGGNLVELFKLQLSGNSPLQIDPFSCLIAFLSSSLMGFIVIRFAMKILEKGHLKPFAWYCLVLGVITTLYLNS